MTVMQHILSKLAQKYGKTETDPCWILKTGDEIVTVPHKYDTVVPDKRQRKFECCDFRAMYPSIRTFDMKRVLRAPLKEISQYKLSTENQVSIKVVMVSKGTENGSSPVIRNVEWRMAQPRMPNKLNPAHKNHLVVPELVSEWMYVLLDESDVGFDLGNYSNKHLESVWE